MIPRSVQLVGFVVLLFAIVAMPPRPVVAAVLVLVILAVTHQRRGV